MRDTERTCGESTSDSRCSDKQAEDDKMQAKQSHGGTAVLSKAPKNEKIQTKPLQQRLANVKVAVKNQSSATRANLSGRFKVS